MLQRDERRYVKQRAFEPGGFGTSYFCTDTVTNTDVVLKEIPKEKCEIHDFQAVTETLKSLIHPNITRYIDSFEDDENYYFVTEYIEGGDLKHLLESRALAESEVVWMLHQILQALYFLQELRITHLNLKPTNIFLDSEQNIKVGDFGLSVCHPELYSTNEFDSAWGYEAPERIFKQSQSFSADIWSAGTLLYEMVTRERPFATLKQAIIGEYKPLGDEVNKTLRIMVKMMLVAESEKRPAAKDLCFFLDKNYKPEVKENEQNSIEVSRDALKQAGEVIWETENDVQYAFDYANDRLLIQGTRPLEENTDSRITCQMISYPWAYEATWLRLYRNQIRSVVVCHGVSTIGARAFQYCHNLVSVFLPESVTMIRRGAFWNCYNLVTFEIPDRVISFNRDVFAGCKSLKSLVIPASVTEIGRGTFWNCSGLKSVEFKNCRTKIGRDAFLNCSSLTSLTFPDGIISIECHAFFGCDRLVSVSIPKHLAPYTSEFPVTSVFEIRN